MAISDEARRWRDDTERERKTRESMREALAALRECTGFFRVSAPSRSFGGLATWPTDLDATLECGRALEGAAKFESRFPRANLRVSIAWVRRTWIPAADRLREAGWIERVKSLVPGDVPHREAKRCFVRVLESASRRDVNSAIRNLIETRAELGSDRVELAGYFDWLRAQLAKPEHEGEETGCSSAVLRGAPIRSGVRRDASALDAVSDADSSRAEADQGLRERERSQEPAAGSATSRLFVTRKRVADVRCLSDDALRHRIDRKLEEWPAVRHEQAGRFKRTRAGWWLDEIRPHDCITEEMIRKLRQDPGYDK